MHRYVLGVYGFKFPMCVTIFHLAFGFTVCRLPYLQVAKVCRLYTGNWCTLGTMQQWTWQLLHRVLCVPPRMQCPL